MKEEEPQPLQLRVIRDEEWSTPLPEHFGSAVSVPVPEVIPAPLGEHEQFQLQVANDIEHERVVLYRALVIVEAIIGMILLRQALLWWLLP